MLAIGKEKVNYNKENKSCFKKATTKRRSIEYRWYEVGEPDTFLQKNGGA
jgi:hypothetical protein